MLPGSHLLESALFACVSALSIVAAYPSHNTDLASLFAVSLAGRDTTTSVTVTLPLATVVISAPDDSTRPPQHSTQARVVTTVIAVLSFILTASTYAMLVTRSTPLSNQALIPVTLLRKSLSRALERTWPSKAFGPHTDFEGGSNPLVLLADAEGPFIICASEPLEGSKKMPTHEIYTLQRQAHKLSGYSEVVPIDDRGPVRSSVSIPAASPVIKHIIQALVWEWVGILLAMAMIASTIVFNGIVTSNHTPDSWLRLGLVLTYATAMVAHARYAYSKMYQALSCLVIQATWLLLMRHFAFGDGSEYARWTPEEMKPERDPYAPQETRRKISKMIFQTFDSILMGEIKLKRRVENTLEREDKKVQAVQVRYHNWSKELGGFEDREPKDEDALLRDSLDKADTEQWIRFYTEMDPAESTFAKQVKPLQDSELKILEKAAESALERTVANTAVILGICLAAGLASWTSVSTTEATTTQLGSYALLVSVSTGLFALVSSASHAKTLSNSATVLLRLQEHILGASWQTHLKGDPEWDQHKEPRFTLRRQCVTSLPLWASMGSKERCLSLFFGVVLSFLPPRSARASSIITMKVNNNEVTLGGNALVTSYPLPQAPEARPE